MHIFISWSGDRSRALAECLRRWLPLVIQSVDPWFSDEDLDKGSRWLSELGAQLDRKSLGIICLTPESTSSPWLIFEAGALSKALDTASVCPVLVGLEPNEVQGPLAQFQATRTTKEELRKLLATINKRLPAPLADSQIDTVHDLLWPDLAAKLKAIENSAPKPKDPHRTTPDLLNEVLTRVRSMEREIGVLLANGPASMVPTLSAALGPSAHYRQILEQRISTIQSRLNDLVTNLDSIDSAIAGTTLSGSEFQDLSNKRHRLLDEMMAYQKQMKATYRELAGNKLGTGEAPSN